MGIEELIKVGDMFGPWGIVVAMGFFGYHYKKNGSGVEKLLIDSGGNTVSETMKYLSKAVDRQSTTMDKQTTTMDKQTTILRDIKFNINEMRNDIDELKTGKTNPRRRLNTPSESP